MSAGISQRAAPGANLLSLRRVQSPKGRVLGPQAPRGVGLLQLRDARVHHWLERAEAVPLPWPLPSLDVLALLLDGGEQTLKRLGEGLHAFDLELTRDLVEVDAELGEQLQLPLGGIDVFVDASARLAMLADRGQRGG